MRILIFTPFYKRSNIVQMYADSIRRLKAHWEDLDVFGIVSPEDRHYARIVNILFDLGAHIVEFPNQPLGRKKNAGLRYALKHHKFDYLMELNSDAVVNPEIFDIYRPYMEKNTPFVGLKNIYFHNYETKETVFVADYAGGMSYGSGRIYHREYLPDNLWPDEAGSGLDTASYKNLRDRGIKETMIDTGDHPIMLDIKTRTNIFPWELVISPRVDLTRTYVNWNDIAHYFGMTKYDDWILKLQEPSGFADYVRRLAGGNMTYARAYEQAEKTYENYYGRRRYKNYVTFRNAVS